MKKLFIVILLCLFCIPISAQTTFPYSKFLSYTDEQLAEARFKYDNNKNQWVLAKGFTPDKTEAKRLAKLFPNQTPSEDNYRITIQNGANGVAFIDVLFYKDATFHELLTFAKEYGKNLQETNLLGQQKYQFDFEDFSIELSACTQEVKATTHNNTTITKTQDTSYNIYNYKIRTGIEPTSPWLTKQRTKQEKRDSKGKKKQSISNYM